MDWAVSFLNIFSKFGSTTRSFVKFLLHSITGKCELERICEAGKYSFKECQDVEYALYHSKQEDIRRLLVADTIKVKNAMQNILRVKRIIPEEGLSFLSSMPKFLRKIVSYNKVLADVDALRSTKYDEEDSMHEALLYKLWELLKGDDKLEERHTSRWTEIGFQGKNPATDFRGMGLLGLMNLVYLMEHKKDMGLKIFGLSRHPSYGFSFAIVGINFTGTAFDLMRNGKMKGYLYNLDEGEYALENYQNFFSELLLEFAEYWVMREPPNIMSFNEIRDDYLKEVNKRLDYGKWSTI